MIQTGVAVLHCPHPKRMSVNDSYSENPGNFKSECVWHLGTSLPYNTEDSH